MRWRTLHKRKSGRTDRLRLLRKAPALPALLFKFSYDGSQIAESMARLNEGIRQLSLAAARAMQQALEGKRCH
jgi:hypothetical protein